LDFNNRTKYREFPLLGWVLTDVTVESQPLHCIPYREKAVKVLA
jgi:hypothetical protein